MYDLSHQLLRNYSAITNFITCALNVNDRPALKLSMCTDKSKATATTIVGVEVNEIFLNLVLLDSDSVEKEVVMLSATNVGMNTFAATAFKPLTNPSYKFDDDINVRLSEVNTDNLTTTLLFNDDTKTFRVIDLTLPDANAYQVFPNIDSLFIHLTAALYDKEAYPVVFNNVAKAVDLVYSHYSYKEEVHGVRH